MSIGNLIKQYLNENNIPQVWLSKKTNLTPSQLSSLLSDKRKLTVEEYSTIMEALNLDINAFAGKRTLVDKFIKK